MAKWNNKSFLIDTILELIDSGIDTITLLMTKSSSNVIVNRLNLTEFDTYQLKKIIPYMKTSNLLQQRGEILHLTPKARQRLKRRVIASFKLYSNDSPWDKKWRVVLFEIPESKKSKRDAFTSQLKDMGFVYMHRGILINPFDQLEHVATVAELFDITDEVSTLTTDSISSKQLAKLKNHFFGLKLD